MNTLPKLDFLYFNLEQTEDNYYNRKNLYYEKFPDDFDDFDDFVTTCSFEELLYLMIYMYKDKYPRNLFRSVISVVSTEQNIVTFTNQQGREVSEDIYIYTDFMRSDITAMQSQIHNENYTDDEVLEKYWSSEYHMQNLYIEFNKEIPLEIIEKALQEKNYLKTSKEDTVIYEVQDSPIAFLEITKNSIKLIINEDKIISYVNFIF